jgi:PAS domain S-box-containing protein
MSHLYNTTLLLSHLNTILNTIPAGLIVIETPNGKIIFANEYAKKLFGADLVGTEILNAPTALHMHSLNGKTFPTAAVPAVRALSTGQAGPCEEIIVNGNEGARICVKASAVPLKNAEGNVSVILGIFENITEQKQAEEVIQRFSDAAKLSLEGIVLCDKDLKIIDVNEAALKIYKATTQNDLLGKDALSLLQPKELEKAYKKLNLLLKTGHVTAEFVAVTKKGKLVPIEYSGAIMKDTQGQVTGFFSVLKDLSERKKTEQALKQASFEWERTFDSVPDLIAILDDKFTILKVNRAMARQLGVTQTQCIGLTCYESIHGLNEPPEFCPHAKTLQDGKEHIAEVYEPRLGGHFLVSTTPLNDEKGKMVGSVHVARNITERIRLEEELKLSQDRYRAAVEGCNDGIWDRDLKTKKVFFSDQWKRMLGYEPSEITDTIEEFDKLIHPEDREDTWLKIRAHIRGETPFYKAIFRMKHRDGSWRWILSRGSVIRDKDGTLSRIAGSHTDITEQKHIEEKLNQYTRNLEALVEARTKKLKETERLATIGETAGMVGHDIRNPLQSIIGEIYLAKQELQLLPESKQKQSLIESGGSIAKSVEYINKIVLDLQDYAKTLKPVAQETNLKNLVSESLQKIDAHSGINVKSGVADDVCTVVVDPAFLKRILDNLIINAVQAMPNGGNLTVNAKKEDSNLVITVKDTGVGITKEVKGNLFTPLFTTKSKGQGFGLVVVKRLTEALNGTVKFDSRQGKGTTFTIKIPLPN